MNLPRLAAEAARPLSPQVRQALLDALQDQDEAEAAVFTVAPACVPLAPALLAAALPGSAAAREERRALYVRCLAHYRRAVGSAGEDDLGAAAAHFVAANLRAVQGLEVTAELFQPLQRQLAAGLRAVLAAAPPRERQVHFEKFAILAVLLSETWTLALRQGPAAMAHVRQAARAYLAELLGLQAEQLALGPEGLRLRAGATAAA